MVQLYKKLTEVKWRMVNCSFLKHSDTIIIDAMGNTHADSNNSVVRMAFE